MCRLTAAAILLLTTSTSSALAESPASFRVDVVGQGPGAMANHIRPASERQFAPISDHRIAFVEDARHFVILDNPAAVAAAMRAFLN